MAKKKPTKKKTALKKAVRKKAPKKEPVIEIPAEEYSDCDFCCECEQESFCSKVKNFFLNLWEKVKALF